MNDKEFFAVFFSTLLFFVTVSPFAFLFLAQDNFQRPEAVNVDRSRNENSTPRTFVLPASPAVAAEQERKIRVRKNATQIQRCLITLIDKGYRLSDVSDVTSDRIFFETLRYQFDIGISATGELDTITRNNLKC